LSPSASPKRSRSLPTPLNIASTSPPLDMPIRPSYTQTGIGGSAPRPWPGHAAVSPRPRTRTHTCALQFRPPRSPDCTLRSVAARRRSRCAHRRRSATSAAAPLAAAAGVAAIAAAPPRFQAAASLPGSRLGFSVPGPSRLPSTNVQN
jgi:hypothetical protein